MARVATKLDPRAASTHGRIYSEAIQQFCLRGYHGTSLRDIARAAEIQLSTFYYYYPSKQSILISIMQRTMTDLTDAVRRAMDSDALPRVRLERAIHAHVRFHAERPMEALIADSELRALETGSRNEIVARRDQYEQIFRDLMVEFRLPREEVRVSISALMAMCTAVAVWYSPDGPLSIDEIADRYARLFLRGVTAFEAPA